MSRIFCAIILIVVLSFISPAQKSKEQVTDKPDFTGVWEIENKDSNPVKNHTLIINQLGDELNLAESYEIKGKIITNKTTLYLDQRGERNLRLVPGADVAIEVKSKTSWKKDKLITKSTFSSPVMIGAGRYMAVYNETQTYSLSKDGNSLTVETLFFRENPLSDRPSISAGKKVYRRKN